MLSKFLADSMVNGLVVMVGSASEFFIFDPQNDLSTTLYYKLVMSLLEDSPLILIIWGFNSSQIIGVEIIPPT